MTDCVFCRIVAGTAPATIVCRWRGAVAFLPREPRTPGHVLVIPTRHVRDSRQHPLVTGMTFFRAAQLARRLYRATDFNLISNTGPSAPQTVFHLHVHLIPRQPLDGVDLPWTNDER